jgi:hypothetical protein
MKELLMFMLFLLTNEAILMTHCICGGLDISLGFVKSAPFSV